MRGGGGGGGGVGGGGGCFPGWAGGGGFGGVGGGGETGSFSRRRIPRRNRFREDNYRHSGPVLKQSAYGAKRVMGLVWSPDGQQVLTCAVEGMTNGQPMAEQRFVGRKWVAGFAGHSGMCMSRETFVGHRGGSGDYGGRAAQWW